MPGIDAMESYKPDFENAGHRSGSRWPEPIGSCMHVCARMLALTFTHGFVHAAACIHVRAHVSIPRVCTYATRSCLVDGSDEREELEDTLHGIEPAKKKVLLLPMTVSAMITLYAWICFCVCGLV